MPARQPAIQLRSNRTVHSSTPPFQLPSHLLCKPLMLSPSIFPMQMHPRSKADRMFARQTKCKSCSGGLRRSMRNREQEANRMHPFDARASGYVRSVMCVFERVLRRRSIVVGDMTIMCKEKGYLSVRWIVVCIICDRLSKYFSFVCVVVFGISHQKSVVQDS